MLYSLIPTPKGYLSNFTFTSCSVGLAILFSTSWGAYKPGCRMTFVAYHLPIQTLPSQVLICTNVLLHGKKQLSLSSFPKDVHVYTMANIPFGIKPMTWGSSVEHPNHNDSYEVCLGLNHFKSYSRPKNYLSSADIYNVYWHVVA